MVPKSKGFDYAMLLPIIFLTTLSVVTLRSIAPQIFPAYFIFIALGISAYLIFSRIDYKITEAFSKFYYIGGIVLLLINLIAGRVTRGVVRWIPFGGFSIQPAEIVRPFLIVYFAYFFYKNPLNTKTFLKSILLLLIPVSLILIQPSLSVSVITTLAFIGVILSSGFSKKILLSGLLILIISLPLVYMILAPYQKTRINTFLSPNKDPLGAGYNSIQSMISVGSGKLLGRGLGNGVQTQLLFLPERNTDFVYASIAEELGFLGATITILLLFVVLYRVTSYIEHPINPSARAYLTGVILSLSAQVFVNIAMNLGLLPVAGLPLPIVSSGGSSYLATMIMLGIATSAWRKV